MVSQSEVLPMIMPTTGLAIGDGLKVIGARNAYNPNPLPMTNNPRPQARPPQTSDIPRGTRTTVVPAILSCQDCLSSSITTQMKPSPQTTIEMKQLKAR